MIEWMTVSQAAAVLGVNHRRVRQLCISGKLKAEKFGRAWMVDSEDVMHRSANPSPHRRKP